MSLDKTGMLERDARRMTHEGDSAGLRILVLRVDTTRVDASPHSRAVGLPPFGTQVHRASDTIAMDRRTTNRSEYSLSPFPLVILTLGFS